MEDGVPLFGVKLIVFLYFVVEGVDVGVGDAVVDDFDVVPGEEVLDVAGKHPLGGLGLHAFIKILKK